MPRILIAECKQEVSTFNPHLSNYEDFKVRQGEEMLRYHRSVRNEIGGALEVFEQAGVEIVPSEDAPLTVPYTVFKEQVAKGNVASIYAKGESIEGRFAVGHGRVPVKFEILKRHFHWL